MLDTNTLPPRLGPRAPVIALHCSGGTPGQWRPLAAELGPDYELTAPSQYGSEPVGPWTGEHAFTLADEAAPAKALMAIAGRKVHLVGHSYGGGLALHLALARPDKVAGLALYEPAAFHLLKQSSADGAVAFAEIIALNRQTADSVMRGAYREAAAAFVNYWGGRGTWATLDPPARRALTRWAPKAPLDFSASLAEATPLQAYGGLRCPVLILRGEHSPAPSRIIAETLTTLIPTARLDVVTNAGHMGPLRQSGTIAAAIAGHIADAERTLTQPLLRPVT